MHNYDKKSVFSRVFGVLGELFPAMFWALLILGFHEFEVAIITLLCAIIHECGHIGFLSYINKGKKHIRAAISGMRISTKSNLSYRQERLMYLWGPLANIITALAAIPLLFITEVAGNFIMLSLATALSNLLPIEGYDGYGILRSIVNEKDFSGVWLLRLSALSCGLIFSFCVFSLYLIDRCDGGYWIFAIFFVSMLRQIHRTIPR